MASETLEEGRVGGGGKPSTLGAKELLATIARAHYVLLTTSATHALQLAYLAYDS